MDIQGKIHCLAVKFQMKMVKLKVFYAWPYTQFVLYIIYKWSAVCLHLICLLITIIGTYTIPDANGDPILVRYKAGPKTGYVVDNLDEVLERTNPQGSSGDILFEMTY